MFDSQHATASRRPRRVVATLVMITAILAAQHTAHGQLLPDLDGQPEAEAEPTPAVIEASEDARPADDEIRTRLEGIFSNLPGLADVTVQVRDGVIVLEGVVDNLESRERAAQLAERMRGGVAVVNDIVRDRSIGRRLETTMSNLNARLKDLVGGAPVFVLAAVVVLIAGFAARLIGRGDWLFERLSQNWFVRNLLRQIVQVAVLVTGVVIALQLLDASALLGSLLGALGIVGLAVGFATRDTVENYIASILLSIRQPFAPHEHVSIEGVEGKVLRLTSRATVLMSLDGNHVRIPNAKVYKATIVNYTRNPLRRFEFEVGVDTGIELDSPRDIALETLALLPGVARSPRPQCLIATLGDSSVVLRVQGWVDQREADFQKVRSEAQRVVKEAFDDAGIVMPEPIYNVNLRQRDDASRAPAGTSGSQEPPHRDPAALDTAPDQAVDEQIRAERGVGDEQDLLDPRARSE